MSKIEIRNLSFSYPQNAVFELFNLNMESEAINVIMGASGCGKTTLLHLLASLLQPQAGSIQGINNKRVSYIFQEPRLLPWRTVIDNIKLTLNYLSSEAEKNAVALEMIEKVGLSRYQTYYPHQLSGGMRQRVSMARAFAFQSDIILLDEPFQNLDIKLKEELIQLFLCLWEADKRTVVCVTHDVDEALKIANAIFILGRKPGQVASVYPCVCKSNDYDEIKMKQILIEQLNSI